VNDAGDHPEPYSSIGAEEIEAGFRHITIFVLKIEIMPSGA
jgi:hypothetical protein